MWNFVVRMNSAQATEFHWMVLYFRVTSMTAMVALLDTAPMSSLTPSCRMSFSALRAAGAGLLSSSSQAIPIVDGSLMLGRWQRVFFCELDRSRPRKIFIQVIGE